jgi:hypothetical protein
VRDIFKQQTLREPKLVQLDNTHKVNSSFSKGKPIPGSAVIEKAKCFCKEMRITDKCALSNGWLWNFKELMSVWAPSDNPECPIIQHLSGPMHIRLMEFYCMQDFGVTSELRCTATMYCV